MLLDVTFTRNRRQGWGVGSCEEVKMNRFHWQKVCCCCCDAHLLNDQTHTHTKPVTTKTKQKKPVQEDKNKYCHNWNIQPYPCRWQLSFPEARLNFLPLRDLEHIWSSDSSAWIRCACSGPLTDTLWTAHAPVSWWGFPRWTTSTAVNGCRGTGGAGGAREECRFKTRSKYPRRPELTAASSNYLSQFQLFNKCCPLAFQDSIHWGPLLKLRKETIKKISWYKLNLSFVLFSYSCTRVKANIRISRTQQQQWLYLGAVVTLHFFNGFWGYKMLKTLIQRHSATLGTRISQHYRSILIFY